MSRPYRRSALRQSFSFHRLRNASVAERIVASTGLAPPALVYEFGAGDGVLTAALAPRAGRVVAIELDRTLYQQLCRRVDGLCAVKPLHADFRTVPLPARGSYAVVANLPFSLTAETVRMLLGARNPPANAFLVVQREVAVTWTGAGRSTMAATLAHLEFTFDVPLALRRRDFEPWPRVATVVLAIRKRPAPLLPGPQRQSFGRFVRRGFGGGRFSLERNLRGLAAERGLRLSLQRAGVSPGAAPSSLAFEQWLRLWQSVRDR